MVGWEGGAGWGGVRVVVGAGLVLGGAGYERRKTFVILKIILFV